MTEFPKLVSAEMPQKSCEKCTILEWGILESHWETDSIGILKKYWPPTQQWVRVK